MSANGVIPWKELLLLNFSHIDFLQFLFYKTLSTLTTLQPDCIAMPGDRGDHSRLETMPNHTETIWKTRLH